MPEIPLHPDHELDAARQRQVLDLAEAGARPRTIARDLSLGLPAVERCIGRHADRLPPGVADRMNRALQIAEAALQAGDLRCAAESMKVSHQYVYQCLRRMDLLGVYHAQQNDRRAQQRQERERVALATLSTTHSITRAASAAGLAKATVRQLRDEHWQPRGLYRPPDPGERLGEVERLIIARCMAGATYPAIAVELNLPSKDDVARVVHKLRRRGHVIPPPPRRRQAAPEEHRAEALALFADGATYQQVMQATGVAKRHLQRWRQEAIAAGQCPPARRGGARRVLPGIDEAAQRRFVDAYEAGASEPVLRAIAGRDVSIHALVRRLRAHGWKCRRGSKRRWRFEQVYPQAAAQEWPRDRLLEQCAIGWQNILDELAEKPEWATYRKQLIGPLGAPRRLRFLDGAALESFIVAYEGGWSWPALARLLPADCPISARQIARRLSQEHPAFQLVGRSEARRRSCLRAIAEQWPLQRLQHRTGLGPGQLRRLLGTLPGGPAYWRSLQMDS